jgi:predicted nuclease with TOPRIM domain
MNENQHLRTENAKLIKELTQLKAQNNNNNDIINTEECNEDKNNLQHDVEITKLKARIDELENTLLSPSSVTARHFHSSSSGLYNQSNNNTNINPYSNSQRFAEGNYNQGMMMPKENDVKECLFNAINELKEKEKIIDNLKSKLRETIHSKSQINYLDDQHIQNSMIQTLKQKDDMIKNLQSRYNASSSLNNENNNNNI